MSETEEILRAALAAATEPADAGFARQVAMRVEAIERRRGVVLALLMTTGALLLAAMFVGLLELEPLWELLARQNWFSLPALNAVAGWESVAGFIAVTAIAFPMLRSRT